MLENMRLDVSQRNYVVDVLETLKFVQWDRFTFDSESVEFAVFGWIPRKQESYKDFVYLRLDLARLTPIDFATSSETYSKTVARLLEFNHLDCQRVESAFNITNMIVIGSKKRMNRNE